MKIKKNHFSKYLEPKFKVESDSDWQHLLFAQFPFYERLVKRISLNFEHMMLDSYN